MPVEGRRGGRRLAWGAPPRWWRGRRSRALRWGMATILAATVAVSVTSASSRAQRTLAGYGTLRRVPVARHDLSVGHTLAPGDLEWRNLPPAAVPDDVVLGSPVGRTVVDRVARGEVIAKLRVAPDGLSALAALVPTGHRAVALPRRSTELALVAGDRVDVLAAPRVGSEVGDGSGPAQVVARAAPVLAVTDQSVVVAVGPGEAGSVAAALAQGQPVLALVGS